MAALIIPNNTAFGSMTNQTTSRLIGINTSIARLKDAIATASAGYTGTPGTEFETANMMSGMNNFGVQADPDPDRAGENGTAYAYAVNTLAEHWATFWAAAEASIEQLDNGGMVM